MKVAYTIFLIFFQVSFALGAAVSLISEEEDEPTENFEIEKPVVTDKYVDPSKSGKHPLGVKADCSAAVVSAEELENIAKNADSTIDFLKSIPQDSFQSFTLITNSKSAQRCEGEGKVNAMWPRVLRSSADGKMTFSYTCNPESCAYNKVEVIYYDDNGKQLNTMSLNFAAKEPAKKVHHNDQSCLNCHGSNPEDPKSFKHIWPEYFQWGGCKDSDTINMYGSNDDGLNADQFRNPSGKSREYSTCSNDEIQEHQKTEIANFESFKKMHLTEGQNFNPCYGLLPWAKPTGEKDTQFDADKFKNYPYFSDRKDIENSGNTDGFENLYLRTNQRFTQNYARINAARIAARIEETPNYERIKFFLALEAAGCLEKEDEATIKKLIPSFKYSYREPARAGNGQDTRNVTPLLYDYSIASGLKDADWTLEYLGKNPSYNASIPRTSLLHQPGNGVTSDTGIAEVASAELLKNLATEYPAIGEQSKTAMTKGAQEAFGPQWACMDEVGGTVKTGYKGPKRPLCTSIRAELAEYIKTATPAAGCPVGEDIDAEPVVDDLSESAFAVEREFNEDSAKRGQKIVQKRCMECHNTNGAMSFMVPDSFHFFAENADSEEAQALAKKKMMSKLKNYEAALRSGRMPADGGPLSEQEIDDVLMYIDSMTE